MFNNLRNKLPAVAGVVAAAGATVGAASAQSTGVDVGEVVTAIQGASGPIASIGAAVLIVMVGIKVYKWVRRAM